MRETVGRIRKVGGRYISWRVNKELPIHLSGYTHRLDTFVTIFVFSLPKKRA